MNSKYKLAVIIDTPYNLRYGGRYIKFNEVLYTQDIGLTPSYASLAIF